MLARSSTIARQRLDDPAELASALGGRTSIPLACRRQQETRRVGHMARSAGKDDSVDAYTSHQ